MVDIWHLFGSIIFKTDLHPGLEQHSQMGLPSEILGLPFLAAEGE